MKKETTPFLAKLFTTSTVPYYHTVQTEDTMNEENDDDLEIAGEDVALTNPGKKSFRRRREIYHRDGDSFVRYYSIFVLTLVGAASIAVITSFMNSSHPTYNNTNTNNANKPSRGSDSLWFSLQDGTLDQGTLNDISKESKLLHTGKKTTVHYDTSGLLHSTNPFDIQVSEQESSIFNPPGLLTRDDGSFASKDFLGYLQKPHVLDDHIVFCSEGDIYVSTIPKKEGSHPFPATKLTTTDGNAQDPKLHPSKRYLAYTATYSHRRDIYLMDLLQPRSAATRLTFWDSSVGVSGLIGWWGQNSLVFRAISNEASLPDQRLYILHLNSYLFSEKQDRQVEKSKEQNESNAGVSLFQIDPIPLSQAIDAARYETKDKHCWYFTRFSQSSKTIRYVGGTAESLWKYCDGKQRAFPLTENYNGTSKSPQIYNNEYLFFLSDRAKIDGNWIPDRMNIWALSLMDEKSEPIQVTNVGCDFEGRLIREYSIDSITGNVVARIGADLYLMEKTEIVKALSRRRLMTNETTSNDADLSVDDLANTTNATEEVAKVYYSYSPPEMKSRKKEAYQDHHSGTSEVLKRLPIVVHSDFSSHQEGLIPIDMMKHLTSMDFYESVTGEVQALMTLRGQLWVAPIVDDTDLSDYSGGGMNMPPRRYKIAPGSMMGGTIRILATRHVPNPVEDDSSDRRLALILATDPLTDTAEHAFYLVETHAGVSTLFTDIDDLPKPFLGGHVKGGSTSEGGLGSVIPETITISPCGRRMAWSDTDGRILVMNMPQYQNMEEREYPDFKVLPKKNEMDEPMVGDEVTLKFSPGGRYLAVNHNARNQFTTISIVDLGDPEGENKVAEIQIGRIVHATPSRYNCFGMYWGKSLKDRYLYQRDTTFSKIYGGPETKDFATTTLYFLSDRDIQTDVRSPWGTRAPMPHFTPNVALYALPLSAVDSDGIRGEFTGGGTSELSVSEVLGMKGIMKAFLSNMDGRRLRESLEGIYGLADNSFDNNKGLRRHLNEETTTPFEPLYPASFAQDMEIDFGPKDLTFARNAYRIANIPEGNYIDLVSQTEDSGDFVLLEAFDDQDVVTIFRNAGYPSDQFEPVHFVAKGRRLMTYGLSSCRGYFYLGFTGDMKHKVVPNTVAGIMNLLGDDELKRSYTYSKGISLSIWPALEYRQMYDDAWRMLRDYFYDPDLTGIDWPLIHDRYLPLVARCAKREELDDVLVQMASELSALHVFVYGGEYKEPLQGNRDLISSNVVASLGAVLKRTPEWKGYKIISIPERDPDFNVIDGVKAIYSPLSEQSLRLSGQKGLEPGDIIVGVNGESVMRVPDIHMLLRGMAGQSVRLDVLRLASNVNTTGSEEDGVVTEPLITVPLHPFDAEDLRYHAWEYKTRQLAEDLAMEAGFSVGYVHLQDMSGPEAENAFARGFFPNYDKEAFILDVRHNRGGNIDSWILDALQRQAWGYWQSRDFNPSNGGLGWDEQFAFRGHIVVLIDEKTSSDGEGVSRGISELGLGRLIGTRTWGGGIWLSSDNHLVDGGIATAPEVGTYNGKFGWGLGVEQMGVSPDIPVDNDPHQSFQGKDAQLERAIKELQKWLEEEPIIVPEPPKKKKDMTMGDRECSRQ